MKPSFVSPLEADQLLACWLPDDESSATAGLEDFVVEMAEKGASADVSRLDTYLNGKVERKTNSSVVRIRLSVLYGGKWKTCLSLLPFESERLLRCIGNQVSFRARFEKICEGPQGQQWFQVRVKPDDQDKADEGFQYLEFGGAIEEGGCCDFSFFQGDSLFRRLMAVDMSGGCTDVDEQASFCGLISDFLSTPMLPLPVTYFMRMTIFRRLMGLQKALGAAAPKVMEDDLKKLSSQIRAMQCEQDVMEMLQECVAEFNARNADLPLRSCFQQKMLELFGDGKNVRMWRLGLMKVRGFIERLTGCEYNALADVQQRVSCLMRMLLCRKDVEKLLFWCFVLRWANEWLEALSEASAGASAGVMAGVMAGASACFLEETVRSMEDLMRISADLHFEKGMVLDAINKMVEENSFDLQRQANHGLVAYIYFFLVRVKGCSFASSNCKVVAGLRGLLDGRFNLCADTYGKYYGAMKNFFEVTEGERARRKMPRLCLEVIQCFIAVYRGVLREKKREMSQGSGLQPVRCW